MPGLHLYRGNRLESLLTPLSEHIQHAGSLFQPDTIVVQGRGMVPYLQRELAARLGIAANLKFPYPNRLLRDLYGLVSPRPFPFDLHWLAWRIMALLPGLLEHDEFAQIARYIKRENEGAPGDTATDDPSASGEGTTNDPVPPLDLSPARQRRLYRLSRQIADVFDQYIIHRPEMIGDWSRAELPPVDAEQAWQVQLWRALFVGDRLAPDGMLTRSRPEEELNPVVLKNRLLNELSATAIREILPDRLFFFGVTILPALHQEVFAFLAERIDVHVFGMDPTGPAAGADVARPASFTFEDEADGDHVNEFFTDGIARRARERGIPVELERHDLSPDRGTLLHALQADCFENTAGSLPVDATLSVHSCHSPLREVEVLYNYLLDLFDRRPDLSPADVLVAAPDPETYAPLVQAVFEGAELSGAETIAGETHRDDERRLPVRVLGWQPGAGAGLEALLRLWKLFTGRFRAEELLEILELPAVRDRLDLNGTEPGSLRRLVERAGIRWSRDADHRKSLDLPAMEEHSWRFGLDRLVLGYALSDEETICDTPTGPVAPIDALEGESALLFARFLEFVEDCRTYAHQLRRPRPAAAWATLLREIAGKLLARPTNAALEQLLDRFAELSIDPGLPGDLSSSVIPGMLEDLSNDSANVRGGPGGEITFASLLPARQIPFAVICLVGMNQDDFPTRPIQPSFDLLDEKRAYRRREETRLFVEQIVSAREELFISYVGRDIYNNRLRQPSPLVARLMERLDRAGLERDDYLREHRLQNFHPAYFNDSDNGLYSFVGAHFEAARALLSDRREAGGIFASTTDESPPARSPGVGAAADDPDVTELGLDELLACFRSPAEYYLRERLKVNPGEFARLIPDAEPFHLEALDAYWLKRGLIDTLLEEDPDPALFERGSTGPLFERYFEKFRAAGLLPHGNPGAVIFRAHFTEASLFFKDMQSRVDTGRMQRRRFASPDAGRFRVFLGPHDEVAFSGRLPADPEGLLMYRPARLTGRDLIACWIRHLVLNLTGGENDSPETLFVARPAPPPGRTRTASSPASRSSVALHSLRPLDSDLAQRRRRARACLDDLLLLWEAGRRRPLPFFPETSLAYYRVRAEGGDETFALKEARSRWHQTRPGMSEQGEFTQPAVQLCFAYREPVHPGMSEHDDFRRLAERIYRPIFEFLREDIN